MNAAESKPYNTVVSPINRDEMSFNKDPEYSRSNNLIKDYRSLSYDKDTLKEDGSLIQKSFRQSREEPLIYSRQR